MRNTLLKNWYWILISLIGIIPSIFISAMSIFVIDGNIGNAIISIFLANLLASLIDSWPIIVLSVKVANVHGTKSAWIVYLLSLLAIYIIIFVLSGGIFMLKPLA